MSDSGNSSPASPKEKKSRSTNGKRVVKKAKRGKDKGAPKRAMTAYILFSNDHRNAVKAKNPGIGFGEIAKELSKMFKSLTAQEKAKYDKLHEQEKARYQREVEAYKASGGGGGSSKKSKSSKKQPVQESGSDDEGSDAGSGSGSDNDGSD